MRAAIELVQTADGVGEVLISVAEEDTVVGPEQRTAPAHTPEVNRIVASLYQLLDDVLSGRSESEHEVCFWLIFPHYWNGSWTFQDDASGVAVGPGAQLGGIPGRKLVVRERASTSFAAQLRAKRSADFAIAMLELAFLKPISVDVKLSRAVADRHRVEPLSIGPPEAVNEPPRSWDKESEASVRELWKLVNALHQPAFEVFEDSLFAFSSGLTLLDSQPAIAAVSLIASLAALAAPVRSKCHGKLSCSVHGDISLQHDMVGDKQSIKMLIEEALQLKNDESRRGEYRKLIDYVYNMQRSAFVHSARRMPDDGRSEPPHASPFPDGTGAVSKYFERDRALLRTADLTRSALVWWLVTQCGGGRVEVVKPLITHTATIIGEINVVVAYGDEAVLVFPHAKQARSIRSNGPTEGRFSLALYANRSDEDATSDPAGGAKRATDHGLP